MAIPVPGLPSFDTTDEPNTLGLKKWNKWIMSFNLYLAAKGVDSDGQKIALLLYIGEMELQEIYQIIPENAQLTFDQTVQTLNGYFQPKLNLPFQRHLFRKMERAQSETVDQFVSRLRQSNIMRVWQC